MKIAKSYSAVDVHACGQPLRIVTSGIPHLKGGTQLERAAYFHERFDQVRRLLMAEPRGHYGMTGCIVTPPASEDARFGLVFMDNEGMSPMSGHGVLCAVTALLASGELQPSAAGDAQSDCIASGEQRSEQGAAPIPIDTTAGRVTAYVPHYDWSGGAEIGPVSFDNVPSFLYAADVPVSLNGRDFTVDIAFGGAFYAIVRIEWLGGIRLHESALPDLQAWDREIRMSLEKSMTVRHPHIPELAGIHGVVFIAEGSGLDTVHADADGTRSDCALSDAACTGRGERRPHASNPPDMPGEVSAPRLQKAFGETAACRHYRQVTVFGSGQFDRSPGAGVSALMAALHGRGELNTREVTRHEGIAGGQMTAAVASETAVGAFTAIVPRVTGSAYIIGFMRFVVDPADPLAEGFLLR